MCQRHIALAVQLPRSENPAVLFKGARQIGKRALARTLPGKGFQEALLHFGRPDNAGGGNTLPPALFVLMQYFGYLRRDPDQAGYDFWVNVVTNLEPGNYRGMVCAFLTSDGS